MMLEVRGIKGKIKFIENHLHDVALIVTDIKLKYDTKQVLIAKSTDNLQLIHYILKNTKEDSLVVFYLNNAVLYEKVKKVAEFFTDNRLILLIRA
jgi:hypothetical protein